MTKVFCVTCLVVFLTAGGAARPTAAADWQRTHLEPAVQAWMSVVTLLAEDGEREERPDPPRRPDRREAGRTHGPDGHRGMHPPGPPHGRMGPPPPEGPRVDALAMLRDISNRLARMERMLADRGRGGPPPGGPRRGGWGDGGRPEMSPEAREAMREMMEGRMNRMKEARKKWEQASPEEREAMRKQWESRMQEGREQMQEAREKMREVRARFQEMDRRIERLEAEVRRLRQAAETED